ncbi:MAG: ABC transporter ATP-binding protein [Chlorobi bacterium]|nr:ABC transporter ATP-binding protein [Chlorobiota bacterium]
MNDALTVTDLFKQYGKHRALCGVSIEFHAGEVVALMGPNGSGKSTLIKCIVGLVRPDRGTISLFGCESNIENGMKFRHAIGYMPQIARYPETMTVRELFKLLEMIRSDCSTYDRQLYNQLQIEMLQEKQLGSLSGGQRQRVSAALAFYFSPTLLLLDEPTAGLDPISTELIKSKIVQEKRQGKTIVLTTHSPNDALEVADRVVYLYDGVVRIDETIASLMVRSAATSLMGAIAWYLNQDGILWQ